MSTEAASAIVDPLTETPGAEAGGGDPPSFLASVLEGVKDISLTPENPDENKNKTEEPPDKAKKPEDTAEKDKKTQAEDEEPKGMSAAAGARWKELKAAEKAAKARAAELETKLATYEASIAERDTKLKELETASTQVAEVERLRSVLAEYEGELAISRVEATPEYKRSVVEPMARMIGIAERIAKEYDTEGTGHLKERILGILENPDLKAQRKAIADIASEWNEGDRFDLYSLSNDYQVVVNRRKEITSNAKEAHAQIEARQREEAEQAKAESAKTWNRAVTDVWEKLEPHFADLPAEEKTKIRGQVAANTFDAEDPKGKAFASYSAVLLPTVLKQVKTLVATNAELEAKVKSLQSSKPGAGGGNADDIKDDPTDDGTGFLERVQKLLPR